MDFFLLKKIFFFVDNRMLEPILVMAPIPLVLIFLYSYFKIKLHKLITIALFLGCLFFILRDFCFPPMLWTQLQNITLPFNNILGNKSFQVKCNN
uniref:Sp-l11L n=2 Tax=African swine fever virus TaxID=10497 RepID=O93198_ASF|nr:Sp-l11L [African swine fever virus]AAC27016.1 Ug-l11L [African swine fever virus]